MNINLIAPINQLGYGVAGLNILKSLQKYCPVALFPIGQMQITTQEDADAVKKAIDSSRFFVANAPCIKVWHQNDMAQFVGKGEHIGFPIFELDTFNELEKHHLSSVDRLFVCSKWAKDVINNQIDKFQINEAMGWGTHNPPIGVVPLGVDMSIFKPAEPTSKDKIIFFNCGKWEIRKGHDILIEAFKRVAKQHDNVELWMMCSNPFNSPEENNRWHQLYNHPKVKLIPRAETQSQVYNIMSQATCGVFPSRGEGWNLELLEMMACGKHVITTNYSAHTEFCNSDNSYLVPINGVEPAFDGKWFFNQGNWAKIADNEVDILTILMNNFVESYNGEPNVAGIETAKQFSWDNTAMKILNILD